MIATTIISSISVKPEVPQVCVVFAVHSYVLPVVRRRVSTRQDCCTTGDSKTYARHVAGRFGGPREVYV